MSPWTGGHGSAHATGTEPNGMGWRRPSHNFRKFFSELFQRDSTQRANFQPTTQQLGFERIMHGFCGSSQNSCAFAYTDIEPKQAIPPEDDVNVCNEEEVATNQEYSTLQETLASGKIQSHLDLQPLSTEHINSVSKETSS